jgi:hypothetical protein
MAPNDFVVKALNFYIILLQFSASQQVKLVLLLCKKIYIYGERSFDNGYLDIFDNEISNTFAKKLNRKIS